MKEQENKMKQENKTESNAASAVNAPCYSAKVRLNTIYNENCLNTLARMPNNFVDLTVTSPPYDDLRDYNGYSFEFEKIANELYRVTKQGGVVVWVVGDQTIKGSETGSSFRQAIYFQEIGFRIHDTMIYRKNGAAYPPNKKSKRYGQVFEYMFVFSKGAPKTHNLIKDKKNRWAGHKTFGTISERKRNGELKERKKYSIPEFSYRDNIWKINNGYGYSSNDEIAYEHPAIFPEDLAKDHIKTWSNKGDLVYDPMMGSGTTAKMAHLLKRKWVGSEDSKKYVELAEKRLQPYLAQKSLAL